MSLMQFIGVVLVVWLWIVCGVAAFSMFVEWGTHRRDGKLSRASRLLRLWNEGTFKRVL